MPFVGHRGTLGETDNMLRSDDRSVIQEAARLTCQAVVVDLEDVKVGEICWEQVWQRPRHVAVDSVDGVQTRHATIATPPWK